MPLNKIKIIFLFYTTYFLTVDIVECSSLFEITNTKTKDDTLQSDKSKNKWRQQPEWHMDTKSYNSVPYMNVISGNSREWTNFEHSQPLKRSDNAIRSPVPNLTMTEDLNRLNMSDPISKYHCPINLLYGNNLTVKNFFLLMPRSNKTSNETMQQFQSSLEEDSFELKSNQTHPSTSNEIGSLVFNKANDTFAQIPSSLDSLTSIPAANSTLVSEVLLDAGDSTLTASTVITKAPGTIPITPFLSNITVIEDIFIKVLEKNTSSEISLTEEVTSSIMISDSPVLSGGSIIPEGIHSPVTTEYSTIANSAVIETVATTVLNSSQHSLMSVSVVDNQSQTTVHTTLNMNDPVLRTVDKYCETFSINDNSTYTINPVSIGQQSAHFHSFLDEKLNIRQQMPSVKKEKRTLLNKNHRKHFKRVHLKK